MALGRRCQTTELRRAALAQLIERIDFDTSTGIARVRYFVPLPLPFRDGTFNMRATAEELGLSTAAIAANQAKFNTRGVCVASPRGFEPRLPP